MSIDSDGAQRGPYGSGIRVYDPGNPDLLEDHEPDASSVAFLVEHHHLLDGVPVFYSLGNFVFDQTWSLETQQGVMLLLTFEGRRLVAYRFIPVHTDGDGTVHLAPPDEAEAILQRIWSASPPLATPTWEAQP